MVAIHVSHPGCARAPRRTPAFAVEAFLAAGIAAFIVGCSRTPSPAAQVVPEPTSILVEPPTLTLEAGRSASLAAQANDTAGRPIGGATFRFTPSDPRILEVSETGLVSALGPASTQSAVIVASGRHERRVPVVVLPGAPNRIEKLSGDRQRFQAGKEPTDPLEARVVDRWNNPIEDLQFTAQAEAELFDAADVVSNAQGIVRFVVPPISRAGEFEVTLRSSAGHLSTSFTLQVMPGPPASIDRVTEPASHDSKSGALVPIRLLVEDAYGNPVPDIPLTARIAKAAIEPRQSRTDAAGKTTLLIPRATRAPAVTLMVEVADLPLVHRSFTLTFDPP